MEKSGHPPEWTEFSPPPPYNPTAASSNVNNFPVPMIHLPQVGGISHPASHSGGTNQTTIPIEQPGTDLLATLIGHHDRFFLKQRETMGCCARAVTIDVRDANGHQIISSLAQPASASLRNAGDSMRFTDASGNVLLTMAEVGDALTVASGNRIVGTIEGSLSTNLFPKLIPKYVNGQTVCSIRKFGQTRLFLSPLDGAELGRAGELTSEGVYEIRLSPGLDVTTKVMLFAAGYILYLSLYLDTNFGRVGTRGSYIPMNIGILVLMILTFLAAALSGFYLLPLIF